METIKGIVKKVKKDKKGVQLADEQWYSDNFGSELEVSIGDEVEINFEVNKGFKNITSLKVLTKTDNPVSQVSTGKAYDPTTMLVSYAKDLTVANSKPIRENVKEILVAYALVKNCLSEPQALIHLLVGEEPIVQTSVEELNVETIKV